MSVPHVNTMVLMICAWDGLGDRDRQQASEIVQHMKANRAAYSEIIRDMISDTSGKAHESFMDDNLIRSGIFSERIGILWRLSAMIK